MWLGANQTNKFSSLKAPQKESKTHGATTTCGYQESHKNSTPLPVFLGSLLEQVGIAVKSEIYGKQDGVTVWNFKDGNEGRNRFLVCL